MMRGGTVFLLIICEPVASVGGFSDGANGEEPASANPGDRRDEGLTPGLGR